MFQGKVYLWLELTIELNGLFVMVLASSTVALFTLAVEICVCKYFAKIHIHVIIEIICNLFV